MVAMAQHNVYNSVTLAAKIRLKLRTVYSNDFFMQGLLMDQIKTSIPGISKISFNPITFGVDIKFRRKISSIEDINSMIANILLMWLNEPMVCTVVMPLVKDCANSSTLFDYNNILLNSISGLFNFVLTSENSGTIYL